jgi:hypothetical protein
MSQNIEAAEILVRYSSLENLPALSTSEISINQIDWEKIGSSVLTKQQEILIDVLRFILLDQSTVNLIDLLALNDVDLHAVLLAINTKFNEAY